MKWFLISVFNNMKKGKSCEIRSKVEDEFPLNDYFQNNGRNGEVFYSIVSTKDYGLTCGIDEEITIIGDISIHNRSEVIEKLSLKGNIEEIEEEYIIRKIYEIEGIEGFKNLLGEFSFVIVDMKKKITYLVRDQLGIKILFWVKSAEGIHIASDIFLLKEYFDFNNIEKNYFKEFYEMNGNLDSEKTPFMNVFRVKSGHYSIFENNRINQKKYWDLKDVKSDADYTTDEEYIETFKNLFMNAVSFRIDSKEKNSLLLSGGLDSTSIFAAAQKIKKNYLQPISAVFYELKESDERIYFEKLLEKYQTKGIYVCLDNKLQFEEFPSKIPFSYEPSVNSITFEFAYNLAKESSENGFTNILTGFGGDQLLTGSVYAVKDLLMKGEISRALQYLTEYSIYINASAYKNAIKYLWNPDVAADFYSVKTDYYKEQKKTIKSIKSFAQREVYLQINSAKSHIYTDRVIGGIFGVDIKHPFLDRKLIEFAYNLPINLVFRPDFSKYILREAFSEELTPEIVGRLNKTTHLAYFYKGLKKNWASLTKVINDPYVVQVLDLVSQEYWQENFVKWRNGLEPSFDFYTLLAIEVWFINHQVKRQNN